MNRFRKPVVIPSPRPERCPCQASISVFYIHEWDIDDIQFFTVDKKVIILVT